MEDGYHRMFVGDGLPEESEGRMIVCARERRLARFGPLRAMTFAMHVTIVSYALTSCRGGVGVVSAWSPVWSHGFSATFPRLVRDLSATCPRLVRDFSATFPRSSRIWQFSLGAILHCEPREHRHRPKEAVFVH
jgi:hypothetical protein